MMIMQDMLICNVYMSEEELIDARRPSRKHTFHLA